MENEHYICGCAKNTHIPILKKYTLNGQLTPPSLGGPIKKILQHLNLMKLAKTTKHAIKQ